ncbi:MAG: hypothetical protein ACLKAL_08680 [Alkaliphilus sp.]
MQKERIDLRVFVAEALATNKKIEKDINELYKKNKYEAYKKAKESTFYNHTMLCEGSIEREVLNKRVLGLILLEKEDIKEGVMNIIKKGWMKLYNYIITKKEIDLKKIMQKFFDPNKNDDEINAIITISLIIAQTHKINVKENTEFASFLIRRKDHYEEKDINKSTRFKHATLDKNLKTKSKELKNRIFAEHISIKKIQDMYDIQDPKIKGHVDILSMIFDTEDIMFPSLTQHIPLLSKDIEELTALYYIKNKNQNKEEASKFLITGIYIKFMIKAYKEIKNYYFKNNKETMYFEIEKKEEEIYTLSQENIFLTKENKKLKEEISRLKKEYKESIERENIQIKSTLKKKEKEIERLKQQETELLNLREVIFDKKKEIVATSREIVLPNSKVLIIGGHEKWRQKIEEKLPETYTTMDGSNENFSIGILKKKHIFFCTDYMNHAVYYKAINYCRKNKIEVGYLKSNTTKLTIEEIAGKLGEIL